MLAATRGEGAGRAQDETGKRDDMIDGQKHSHIHFCFMNRTVFIFVRFGATLCFETAQRKRIN